jgi:hypothetical protein
VTHTTARVLHTLTYMAEAVAVVTVAAVVVMTVVAARAVVAALPTAAAAIVLVGAAGALTRLAIEAPRAWRRICRWHSWPHRQIRDRTQPATPTNRTHVPAHTRRPPTTTEASRG